MSLPPTFKPITDLSSARILISNDDGINAPGIALLERVALTLSPDVWVVAPQTEQSAASHSLTVRRPLRLHEVSERHFAVDGTPTDSVFLAIRQLLRKKRPTLVLSGCNLGCNIASDITYSGTVAAAMEGTLLGVPSIALSQYYQDGREIKWDTVEHGAPDIIRKLVSQGWPRDVLINVNFPDVEADAVTGIEIVRQGHRRVCDALSRRLDPHGQPYFWIGGERVPDHGMPGTDLNAIARGAISITPLAVDFTARDSIAALERLFE